MPDYIDIVINETPTYIDVAAQESVFIDIDLGGSSVTSVNGDTGVVVLDLESILTEGNDGAALQIKNIADPTDAQDAATKAYVDASVLSIVVDVIATSATPTINCDTTNELDITAAASAMVFTVTGTPVNGQKILYRYKDNGTSRAMSLSSDFVDLVGIPAATTVGKVGTFFARYATSRTKWEILASVTEE